MTLEEQLGIAQLRTSFLEYALAAYARLPEREGIRVLDVGCGRGASMQALAQRYHAEFVGIDVDEAALAQVPVSERVRVHHCGLLDNNFPNADFTVLWDEGVLHILDVTASLAECARLLKPGGYLVSAETLAWHRAQAHAFAAAGFAQTDRVDWEPGCWWTQYYGPLERRLARLPVDAPGRERFDAEVRAVKADVAATDCGHLLFRKRSS